MCNCSDTKKLLERNARLAVLLRNLVHEYHRQIHGPKDSAKHWWKDCDDEHCRKVHVFLDSYTGIKP